MKSTQQNPHPHQLAIIQPSFNSTLRSHDIASLIKQKRTNTTQQQQQQQHSRIISPTTTNNNNNNNHSSESIQDDHPSGSSQVKNHSKRLPPSFINLIAHPQDPSDPTLSQVVMTPTTEEWWSFGGISYQPPMTKSGLSSPISKCTHLQPTRVDEVSHDEEEEGEDQSDHTGSSSSGSYHCSTTRPEPTSSTATTTPDNTLQTIHHTKNAPSDPPNSTPDFSTGLISTEPEPTQALATLTSVNGIINIPSSPIDRPTSGASESSYPFPTLTAMSSYSVGRPSRYPNSPLTSTALLSSLLDKAPPRSAASRPCSLVHDGVVRKSIDPRSYSAMTGHRNLDSFIIHSTAGSGAYGIVNHAQEKGPDGQPIGPHLVIKYIIKQRILADCWKRHKVLGPIPVEIHVLDHLRRVNSRPSMITMAKKLIQHRRDSGECTPIETVPSRAELIDFMTKHEESTDTNNENAHPSAAPPHHQRTGHPNICGILDYFEDSDYYYLVMPRFGHGKDLFEHIEMAPDGLPREEVRRIFGQIVDGVAYLHERNIVHRDLKDENVILDGNGNAQLIDFGSASYVREGSKFETFSGTLDFAAPEVLKGIPHGGKEIDIWALGVILHVLITGECPFWNPEEASKGIGLGTRSRAKLEEHLSKQSNDKTDSEAILDLLDHCLNLDSEKRPPVEIICWHKFFLPQDGWMGPLIPKVTPLDLDATLTTTT